MVMFTTTTALEFFCDKWGSDYPYCEIKKTRSQYYFKWIILFASSKCNDVARRRTPYEVVLAKSFDKDTLQHLLVSKRGIPLTPAMDKIMNWMYCWGRNKSDTWYEDMVELLAFYCHEKIPVSDKELVHEVIALEVKRLCHYRFNTTVLLGWSTYNEWCEWFEHEYTFVTDDFFDLARSSFVEADRLITAAIVTASVPITPVSSSSSSSSSCGVIAAVSP